MSLNYLKNIPSRSHKKHRILLVPEFFELTRARRVKSSNAIQASNHNNGTFLNKAWLNFEEKWKDRG